MDHRRDRRQNTCLETAVVEAAQRHFPNAGAIRYRAAAKNDAQIDINEIFRALPGNDMVVSDARLGGKRQALEEAMTACIMPGRVEWNAEIGMEVQAVDKKRLKALEAEIARPAEAVLSGELDKLEKGKTYLLRASRNEQAGHFQVLYYKEPEWILDSGYHKGRPNVGVLYNTRTKTLGAMKDQIMALGDTWGLGSNGREIRFWEMTPDRVLASARYIELLRDLSEDEVELAAHDSAGYVNRIIAEPTYLSALGTGHYWTIENATPVAQNCTKERYIEVALAQCRTADYPGAIEQLQRQGYFSELNNGKALLNDLLLGNRVDSVKKMLDLNLVPDLLTPDRTGRTPYASALHYSSSHADCPVGLNRSLRRLQNIMLEQYPIDRLPFKIKDVCRSLNTDALEKMLPLQPAVDYDGLRAAVMASSRQCGASQGTYQPLIDIITEYQHRNAAVHHIEDESGPRRSHLGPDRRSVHGHPPEGLATKDRRDLAGESSLRSERRGRNAGHPSSGRSSSELPEEVILERRSRRVGDRGVQGGGADHSASIPVSRKHRSGTRFEEQLMAFQQALFEGNMNEEEAWEGAMALLKNQKDYVSRSEERGLRSVVYTAYAGDRIIEKTVSERSQIMLDELYAKKLAAEDSPRFRR